MMTTSAITSFGFILAVRDASCTCVRTMWREEVGQNPTAQRMVKVEVKVGINDVVELLFNPRLVVIEACEASRWFGMLLSCTATRLSGTDRWESLGAGMQQRRKFKDNANVFRSLFAGYNIVVQLRF